MYHLDSETEVDHHLTPLLMVDGVLLLLELDLKLEVAVDLPLLDSVAGRMATLLVSETRGWRPSSSVLKAMVFTRYVNASYHLIFQFIPFHRRM